VTISVESRSVPTPPVNILMGRHIVIEFLKSKLTDRRSFIGSTAAAVATFAGAVFGVWGLAEAGGCCKGTHKVGPCCLCHAPYENCQKACGETNGCEWTWNDCMECFLTDPMDTALETCSGGMPPCSACNYALCSNWMGSSGGGS
jgi:hypothetical protein